MQFLKRYIFADCFPGNSLSGFTPKTKQSIKHIPNIILITCCRLNLIFIFEDFSSETIAKFLLNIE